MPDLTACAQNAAGSEPVLKQPPNGEWRERELPHHHHYRVCLYMLHAKVVSVVSNHGLFARARSSREDRIGHDDYGHDSLAGSWFVST